LTWKTYGIWWYEKRRVKPRWKTSISNDVIFVQTKEGKENSNVEGIGTLKVDDYLCAVHDVWWCVKPTFVTYKRSQPRQGTCGHYLWDGWALGVGAKYWEIAHG
jgi:hypothetical protein